ncbi:hypothetical protein WJ63_21515 [Burkholderia pyrrocinia]|nr:hypothetical protein WJ63_21515 [Burkholderia pyrrocinia]
MTFDFDVEAWSFSVGALKPDSAIFSAALDMLDLSPEDPAMHALHLNRDGVFDLPVPTIRARFNRLPGMGIASLQATCREVQLRRGQFLDC